MLLLDVRSGKLKLGNDTWLSLSREEMILVYWLAIGAPYNRISTAIGETESYVGKAYRALSEKVGIGIDHLAASELQFRDGTGPSQSVAWADRTMTRLVSHALATRPKGAPLVYVSGEGMLTVREVADLIARIRSAFRREGLAPGDKMALDTGPSIETYLLFLSAYMHGVTIVCLGENAPDRTIVEMLEVAPAALTFTRRAQVIAEVTTAGKIIELGADGNHNEAFEDWLNNAPEPEACDRIAAEVGPIDVAVIGFTSGSTGRPKAVAQPHESLWGNADLAFRTASLTSEDVFCSSVDLTSGTSQFIVISFPLMSGGCVLLPRAEAIQSPVAYALDCEQFGVTCAMMTPRILRTILKSEQNSSTSKLAQLKWIFSSTARLPRGVLEDTLASISATLVDLFGYLGRALVLDTNNDPVGTHEVVDCCALSQEFRI